MGYKKNKEEQQQCTEGELKTKCRKICSIKSSVCLLFCLDAGGTLEVDAADAADSTKWWADELSTWLKDEEAAA